MGIDKPIWKEGAKAREEKQRDAACSSTNIQELQRLVGLDLSIPHTFCEAESPVFRLRARNQNWWTNENIQVTEGLITFMGKVNTVLQVIPKVNTQDVCEWFVP